MAALVCLFLTAGAARAQTVIALTGNHPSEAATAYPVAHADPAMRLNLSVTLALRNRAQLDQLLRDQQNPSSPSYHQWLTPAQFTARFGPSQQDLDAVAAWLSAQGFTVISSSLAERNVRFSGTVNDVERTFRTNIMLFGSGSAYGNVVDPLVPAQFGGVIAAIGGLDNFVHSMAFSRHAAGLDPVAAEQWSAQPLALLDSGPALPAGKSGMVAVPDVTIGGVTAFGPADFRSFYDENSLISSGITGGGTDCIAIVGDSDFTSGAVSLFNTQFGLPASSITTVLVDSGHNPGVNGDELEALLDLEWSHAVAPGASIRFYLGDNSFSSNGAIVDAIQSAVNDNTCGAISVSFGLCGASNSFYTGVVSPIYAQAASQGQSVFLSSGDDGAAGIVINPSMTACVTGSSRNVNELGSDPNVTQVGGTKFNPTFDGAGNNVGHVAEQAWDDEASDAGGATGGGVSAIYAKPAYQKGPGVPSGGNRDVPDVALIASNFHPGVFLGFVSGGSPAIGCCIGGTSLSAPAWAGISKLIAQLKHGRPGPLNPRIYAIAAAGQAAAGLRDVTTGNNNFNGVIGFNAGAGFDLTTGWGTADIGTFANAFVISNPPSISSIPSTIFVGSSFNINGSSFSPGAVVNFFVSTSTGPINAGPLTPAAGSSSTLLKVNVPATVTLGQGFVTVQVVNADAGFKVSNSRSALLQGSAAAGIPTITSINGVGLAATSSNPAYATNNVETVILQGTTVTVGGSGFDASHGVAVNIFCGCTGGRVPAIIVNPGAGLSTSSVSFTLPASVTTGPASIVVVNKGSDGSFSKASNGVSVPVGARIHVTSVTQAGTKITVNGTGFSNLTVINFFNKQSGGTFNLGGIGGGGTARIALTVTSSTQFTFTKPGGAVPGPSYVQAINPPFVPFTSSGNDPGGSFNLL